MAKTFEIRPLFGGAYFKPVIVYLTEPEAHFVSLVKRGVNRTPLHIAKQDKETASQRSIQRITAKLCEKGPLIDVMQKLLEKGLPIF